MPNAVVHLMKKNTGEFEFPSLSWIKPIPPDPKKKKETTVTGAAVESSYAVETQIPSTS